jgi:hypothetical protein
VSKEGEVVRHLQVFVTITITLALAILLAGGCDSKSNENAGGDQAQSGTGSSTQGDLPQGSEPVNLDPKNFTTKIDNPYWPMVPGARWTYRETDQEGAEQSVLVTVSNQTKKIANGITARIVRDTVTEDGEIIEDTFDWYAQDEEGNIWYLGEDTAEFENGKLKTKAGSFEAGVDGAQPGIIMPGDPQAGMKYRQEYYKGEAEDNGEVLSTQEMAEVPYGRYDHALLTKDTTPVEPNVLEYKLYAKGVGPVLTLGVSGGPGSREELIRVENVSEKEAQKAGSSPLGSATS